METITYKKVLFNNSVDNCNFYSNWFDFFKDNNIEEKEEIENYFSKLEMSSFLSQEGLSKLSYYYLDIINNSVSLILISKKGILKMKIGKDKNTNNLKPIFYMKEIY